MVDALKALLNGTGGVPRFENSIVDKDGLAILTSSETATQETPMESLDVWSRRRTFTFLPPDFHTRPGGELHLGTVIPRPLSQVLRSFL